MHVCVCVCGYATVGFPDFCLTFGFGHNMIYAYFLSVKSIEKSVTGKICKHMWGSSGSCVCVCVCVRRFANGQVDAYAIPSNFTCHK